MLDIYAEFAEKYLAMPVIKGQKTESDKFAGAVSTYAIEALMHDGKALQAGTSHYFGDGFAKAFEIQFTGRDNKLAYPHQTSWGVSTRLIGGIIMTHGDDNGLVLPPAVAPIQVVIIPIQQQKEGVLEKANEVAAALKSAGIRVKLDDSNNSPGWKFAEYEMKGVPVRLEIGPRDLAENKCVIALRTGGKNPESLDNITETVKAALETVNKTLFDKALQNRESRTYQAKTCAEITASLESGDGFILAPWCGEEACEDGVTEQTGVRSRCIPFDKEIAEGDKCVCCGKPAKHMVYWAKAY
jgi:prolyl-tRNA synthetase